MSHPEFFSGISRPCCLFSKRESRGRQPFGGVWGVPKISFSSLTRRLRRRVRGKKGLGGTAPNPPVKGLPPLATPLRSLKGPSKIRDDSYNPAFQMKTVSALVCDATPHG